MRVSHAPWAVALIPMLLLSGCKSWQPAAESPQTLIARYEPSSLRVTLRTTERLTLENPTASGDSIFGDGEFGGRMGVPMAEVTLVEERRFSAVRTIITGSVAFVGYVLFRSFFDKPKVE